MRGRLPNMEQTIKSHREIHPSLQTSPGSRSGIWAAGIYLTACGTLSIYSTLTFDGPDANLAGVIPYLVTAPWSLLPLGVLDPDSTTTLSNIIFAGLPVIGALINTVIIHTLARKLSAFIHRHGLGTAPVTHPTPTKWAGPAYHAQFGTNTPQDHDLSPEY
jgi:hypothetical protein